MAENDPLNISGQVVAEKYRIDHLVGEGGFSAVYLAEHTIWKQPVAVKFFSGLSQAGAEYRDELLQQFIQEGALLTELSSQTAGIVQARDVGAYTTSTGQWMPFMVLEWLDGTPLDAILAEDQRQGQPWSEAEVVGFLRRILPILDVAHRRGIAHRDIKPANIFIMGSDTRAPDTPCKLLDFGVAKMVSDQAQVSAALARTGVAITSFTPRYGAPEQFTRTYGATGPWTDVYSAALLACEMLTGRPALEGNDMVQFGFSSANPARRPTPRFLGAAVSDHLEAVFAKALAIRTEERFQHAGELLEALQPGLPHLPAARVPAPRIELAPTVLVRSDGRPMTPVTLKPVPPPVLAPRPDPMMARTITPEPALARTTRPELELERSPSRTMRPAPSPQKTANSDAPAPKEDKSQVASLIFVLVVVVAGFVGYSTTDLEGAKEVRDFFSPVVRLVRKGAEQELPKLREKTRQAMDKAVDILAKEAETKAAVKCPAGTQRVARPAAAGQDGNTPAAEQAAAGAVCIDEHLVSEIDYLGCAVCEQPRFHGKRSKGRPSARSNFCIDGKAATTDPVRCVSWKQAEIYCAAQAARLPTEDELRAVAPTLILAPTEWTSAPPVDAPDKRIPFRCAHEQ